MRKYIVRYVSASMKKKRIMPSTSPARAKARASPNVPAPSMEFTSEITVGTAVAPDLLLDDEVWREDSEEVLEFVGSELIDEESGGMQVVEYFTSVFCITAES